MSSDLRVAVVGLGYFSQFHLAAWQTQTGAKLVGVCDRDTALMTGKAGALGVDCDSDLAALLARTEPDIVDIIAPPAAHDALIRAGLSKGRTIICQKPFCTSLEQARDLIRVAEQAQTRIVIHENFRFQPWYREVRDFLDQGQMGQIYQARFALRPGDGRGPSAYLERQPVFQKMPRLLIHETGVHFIDLFRWLFGDIESVYADLRKLNPAIVGEDAGTLILTHHSGVRSVFDGNRLSDHVATNPRRTMGLMELEGEAGVLSLTGEGQLFFRRFGDQNPNPVPVTRPVDPDTFGGGCVAALIGHVVKALHAGETPENQAADYFHVMQVCEAAYDSATQARRITVPAPSS